MREVTVNKSAVRTRLVNNRREHEQRFERAMVGWRAKAADWHREQAAAIDEGDEEPQQYLPFPVPEDHLDEYDVALDMIDMHEGVNVTLSQGEFRQYMRDEWTWRHGFLAGTAAYIGEHGELPQATVR